MHISAIAENIHLKLQFLSKYYYIKIALLLLIYENVFEASLLIILRISNRFLIHL